MHHDNLAILEEKNLCLREENALLRRSLKETGCGHGLIQQRDEFTKLIEIGKVIVGELDINKVFKLVAEAARELISAELLIVPIIDDNRETYAYLAASGLDSADILNSRYKIGVGMCGWVLENERPLLFGESDEWWLADKTRWEEGQQSALLVPLMGKKQIIGGLSGIGKRGGGSFSGHDLDVLSLFANQVSAAIENARLFHEVENNRQTLILTNQRLQEEIQERLQVEATLRESEERYREIFNSPNDAIFIHDAASGAILDVNRAMLEMYGYDYDEAKQLNVGMISASVPSYTQADAEKMVRKAAQGQPQTFEWLCKRKDGQLFWVEVALKGTMIGAKNYVIASVRDISERREAAAALAAERERLAVTLRSIGDGVIATNTEKNIVMLNKVAEKLTGWSLAEAMGRPFDEVFRIINEQTRQPCENPVDKVLVGGQITGLANHTLLIAKDGVERCIADSCAPILNEKSLIVGVVFVFRDVTERNRLEKELVKIQKLESVGVLAGGLAHDFNNILAAILGNLSLSLMDEELSPSTKEYLQEAEKASLRARDLTQQLLTFAKGGAPIKEVSSLVEVIKDSASFIVRGKPVVCQFSFADDLWLVNIDKGQISQVIQNIVLNACQAITGSGIIRLSCVNADLIDEANFIGLRAGKYVKITISDEGAGMSADLIDKIFDPYFTTKKNGSGLGLAISSGIVNKHGGHLFVTSKLRKGTTFTIYLPASVEGEISAAVTVASPCVPGKTKILLMDDDEMVRTVAKAMLVHLGHAVVLAADGNEAIAIYKESGESIGLVIMDLTIPGGMGGKEAVQKILHINPNAKVMVSSGYSNDPIMAEFAKYGFCGALVKPYQLKEFEKVIKKLMQ
ncbi:MAG: hypothetical protein A2512_00595 [Deltaproteobacteria bacterium RIFOXYD12_FULL_56_24]|nr:MAG: hypothetical protein A2512_00595 [Deltaproteobacteria bacterium RIFOXYD12_FULL_56_24]